MTALAGTALRLTGERRLCLAGGVALNCVANGRLLRDGVVDQLWVQPAAGDAGGALGAALAEAADRGAPRAHVARGEDAMRGALLGPEYADDEIAACLDVAGARYARLDRGELVERVAAALAEGRVVGWFQGRMEYGPRALGARSILGDPRDPAMQSTMNLKIKFRESFRPFAPSVLAAEASRWFDLTQDSPYMLLVAEVAAQRRLPVDGGSVRGLDLLKLPRSTIPAVTHVDGSARIQTVSTDANPDYARLLTAFARRSGCPVLVNTSFNVRGEPLVESPEDAYVCFMRTGIDVLAVGSFLLDKTDQPAWTKDTDWRRLVPLD